MNHKKFLGALLAVSVGMGNVPAAALMAQGNDVNISTFNLENNISADKFELINDAQFAKYREVFQVKNISSYTNNGGQYSSSALKYAFDGNKSTHWETGTKNTSEYKNEITVTFEDIESINRIVYASRQDAGYKGFATKVSVYASLTEDGNDFTLVGSGQAARTGDYTEFKFAPAKFKRLKFVFDEVYNEWASASELMFFKEDTVLDKVNGIFTDAAKNELKEEYKDEAVLEELENEAKKHPLYNSLKDTINDAKIILSDKENAAGYAVTTVFDYFNNEEYSKLFRMDYDNIKSIKTNGSHYAQQAINLAVDGNVNTYWETRTANTASFNNEVTLELKEAATINRLVFGARPQDAKGFAEEFEVYATETSAGDNFKLIATGKHNAVKGLIEAKFEPTKVKRIKLVFKKSTQNWATLTELACYYEDEVLREVENLFTNGLMNEINPKYNSSEKMAELEEAVSGHPLEAEYLKTLTYARKIVENKVPAEDLKVTTAVQRGNYGKGTADRQINGNAYTSFESTGKYVQPGETFTVYVDADPNGVMPQICLGASGKATGNWRNFINLKPGKNVITAPANTEPRAVYLINNASSLEQAYAPSIRVEGGTSFPVYVHGKTDPKAFYNELVAYSKNIEYSDDVFRAGNPEGKVFNIAEFVSENCLITTSAMGAIAGLNEAAKQGYDISDTMDSWEEMYEMFQKFLGFEEDAADVKDSYFPNKFIGRVFLDVPLGYADHGYTGYRGNNPVERNEGFFKLIAMPIYANGNDNWCYNHEFGHIFNTKHMVHGEVTNNLFAQEYRRIKNLGGDRVDWNGLMKRFKGEEVQLGYWTNLGILSQLNIAYGYDAYGKASAAMRENVDQITKIEGSGLRRLAVAYSLGLGVNLLDFFEGWGYTDVTPQMEALVSHLPKETRKIEYLYGGAYDYKGTGFTEDLQVNVETVVDKANAAHILKFSIDEANAKHLLGYEIIKDGEVIGYTNTNSFTVKNVDLNENANYQIIPYAKNLSTGKVISENAFTPSLKVEETVTLKLGEAFDPMKYATAASYDGNKITDIKAQHNVDVNQKGSYEVIYQVEDKGVMVEKSMPVTVVGDYDYLSDLTWTKISADWGTPRKDTNIKGRINGDIKTFEKGIGIHANGEIVYDLRGQSYDYLEALVGVDMTIEAQNNSSIQFKVTVDGKVIETTKVLKHADNMVYLKVPVKGAKELKIQISDAGNGNTSDHAVIAEAKLVQNNGMPKLTIEKDVVLKLGETLDDIYGAYWAEDREDGSLTDQVKVTGDVNFKQPGVYTLVYSVTDSEGASVTKERTISIVDMEDFTYVSDYDWKSAECGWGSIRKDTAPSGNAIRLTDTSAQEVVFKKGLGTHAYSTVVYDLSDIDAGYFSAFVGVDRAMYNSVGSVSFQVWLDGVKVEDTQLMRAKDAMRYIEVNLAGAKELKIVATDGGNGNGSDHAVWGDAKFHYANPDNIKVDFSPLEEYIAELNTLDSSRYTDETWTKLAEVKAQAEYLIEEREASQAEADAVLEQLKAAKESLVKVGNKDALRQAAAEAEKISAAKLTAQSVQRLNAAVSSAKAVLYAVASQDAINEAMENLQSTVDGLVYSTGKQTLGEAIAAASSLNEEEYSQCPDWESLKECTLEAEEIYKAPTADEEEALIQRAAELKEMVCSLKEWKEAQTPKLDTAQLAQHIAAAQMLDMRVYTKDSKAGFNEVLTAGKDLLNEEAATQEEIDAAAAQLESAMAQLKISQGKAELKKVMDLAETIRKEDYVQDNNWQAFEICYNHYKLAYELDYTELELYIAHVSYMSYIAELKPVNQ